MAKIPKGLSDKDMFKGYVEEDSMEAQFLAAEAAEDKKRRAKAFASEREQAKRINLAGLDDALTEQLGKKLLELKMELFREGIKNYSMKISREGESMIITPKYKK